MIKEMKVDHLAEAQAILEVQIPAYQVEAEIIGFYEIPPLKDTLESLAECKETFLGYYIQDQLAGFISYVKVGVILDICRVAVHPSYFRKGVASKLLSYLLEQESADKVIVSTGAKNTPAKLLYQRFGFQEVKEIEVGPGVFLTSFEKDRTK